MNENPEASEWSAARGEKWLAQLAGMEAMLAPVGESLIDAMHLDARHRIADIGCGGGGMTLEILRRAPAGSVVHGFDISPALIAFARARKPSPMGGALAFETADMSAAAPPNNRYDRLVSRFGEVFAEAGGNAINHARQSLTARFSRHQEGGVVRMGASVHIFTGAHAQSHT